jgi:hypothetical protein
MCTALWPTAHSGYKSGCKRPGQIPVTAARSRWSDMRALDPRHNPNATRISDYAKDTHLEWHIPALQHAVGSQQCCQHYNTVVSSVSRFKVLVIYFAEILSTEGRTVSRRAFVTTTLDEGNGLASWSGRRYPMDRWLCGLRSSLNRVANRSYKPVWTRSPGRPPRFQVTTVTDLGNASQTALSDLYSHGFMTVKLPALELRGNFQIGEVTGWQWGKANACTHPRIWRDSNSRPISSSY